MKVKFLTILLTASILLVQTLVIANIYRDNRRLSDNFAAFAKGAEYYRINDSTGAARSERILLDNAEIKAYFPEIKTVIGQMDIKLRQLERYGAINSTANYELSTRLLDSAKIVQTIIHDRIIRDTVKLQYISYKDKWIDFRQAIVADSAYTAIQTRDSIAVVQSWERPRSFWFVRWGRKRSIQTVTNANPHASITYSIYIEKKH